MYVALPFCYNERAITMYAVLPFRYNVLTMALNQPVRLYSLLQATLHKDHQDYPSGPYNDIWTLTRLHSFAGQGQGPQ